MSNTKKIQKQDMSEEDIFEKIGDNYTAMEVRIGEKGTAVLSGVQDNMDYVKLMISVEGFINSLAEKIRKEDDSGLFKKLLSMSKEEREQFLRDAQGLLQGK